MINRSPLFPVLLAAAAVGCTGTIAGSGARDDAPPASMISPPGTEKGPGSMMAAGTAATPPALQPPADAKVPPGSAPVLDMPVLDTPARALARCGPLPRRLWKLTPAQYSATLRAFVQDVGDPGQDLVPTVPVSSGGFSNDAVAKLMSQPHFDQLADTAEKLALTMVKTPGRLGACLVNAPTDPACIRSVITNFGGRAFRRPLAADEVVAFQAFFDKELKATQNTSLSLASLLQAFLLSPHFLYRTELGDGPLPMPGMRVELTAYERASALSYFLTNGPPDDGLMQAAGKGELVSRAQIEAQTRRLLASADKAGGLMRFFREQYETDAVLSRSKDDKLFPMFNGDMAQDMNRETSNLISTVLWKDDTKLSTLLTADYTVLTDRLAKLYGLTAVNGQKTTFPAGQRAGLLTMSGIMSALSGDTESDIIRRGRYVRERLLCQVLPPPPPTVNAVPPKPDGVLTQRERLTQHAKDPSCAGCHQLMDPIGYMFEHYDAVGRWRTTELGKPVDASGVLQGVSGGATRADGAIELARLLVKEPETSSCFVRRLASYGLGDMRVGDDQCRVDKLAGQFATSGGNILDAVVAITTADDFFQRMD